MADFGIKQGDTLPVFTDSLTYNDNSAVNLTGATVNFVMRSVTAATASTNRPATIVNALTGAVSYTPTATDSAVVGDYMGNWVVTFPGGAVMTFPTDGWLEIVVQDNLTTPGGQRLVNLGSVKDYLRIPATDRSHDASLLHLIDAIGPIVEGITGPILQRMYQNETYDGGATFISLRHRPVMQVHGVTEYRASIAFPLTQVLTPDLGTIYSYMFEPPGRIVRRTVGGGIAAFPPGYDQVFITYTAGFPAVPQNVREGALELIRANWQPTQQGLHPAFGGRVDQGEEIPAGPAMGFFVPWRVREMLSPNKRHPSVA